LRSTLVFVFLLLLVALGYAVYSGRITVPDKWNPWAPLSIEEPLNWLTRFKLERTSSDNELCLAVLAEAKMRFEPVPDRDTGAGCGFRNAVRIESTSARVGDSFTLSCRAALSLAMWEHHVVQPAARRHFDAAMVRLEHFGSYSCRNVYGRKDAPLSRHATADAFDVAGFGLGNGRRISVERDWGSDDPDGRFLRDVHNGACRLFDSVLGPEYNAAHRNHFHLDRGGYRVCR
jgi:hypothetical protein